MVIPLFLILLFVTAAAAAGTGAAAFGSVGAADAFFAALFGLIDIPSGEAKDRREDGNDHNIFHNLYLPLRAYSFFRFALDLTHSITRIAANSTTTAPPQTAAVTLSSPPVTRVPTV